MQFRGLATAPPRPSRRPRLTYLLIWVTVSALAASCGGSVHATPLEIVADDYRFTLPDAVPAGLVTLNLSNTGAEPHAAQLYRLNDGVTLERFTLAMRNGIEAERALASAVGGPANVDPGDSGSEVSVVLEPGTYVVVCWLLSSDRTPHAFLGMVDTFEVTGEPDLSASPPTAEATIGLSEYVINVPEEFDGKGTFRVVNEGSEWHELVFLKLDEGFTADQAIAHLTGESLGFPAPFASRGGVSALALGGGEATVELDLDDGRYLLFCGVPNSDQVYHADLGMRSEVEIGDAEG